MKTSLKVIKHFKITSESEGMPLWVCDGRYGRQDEGACQLLF